MCFVAKSFQCLSGEDISRTVEELTGGFCVQGLLVNNLRFADDIALITDKSNELKVLTL